jgi:hypothetical protein
MVAAAAAVVGITMVLVDQVLEQAILLLLLHHKAIMADIRVQVTVVAIIAVAVAVERVQLEAMLVALQVLVV